MQTHEYIKIYFSKQSSVLVEKFRTRRKVIRSIFYTSDPRNPTCPHPHPHVFHTSALSRCGAIIRRDRAPVARVHFLQRVPQHIAAPLLLYVPVPRASALPATAPSGSPKDVRARTFVYSPLVPPPSVYVHLGIRRMDASPRSGNSRRSVRQRETPGPSATVIIPRTIYDAHLGNGCSTVKLRRCYFDLSSLHSRVWREYLSLRGMSDR